MLDHVEKGRPFKPSAEDHNIIVDAVGDYLRKQTIGSGRLWSYSGTVMPIRNYSGQTLKVGMIVPITGLSYTRGSDLGTGTYPTDLAEIEDSILRSGYHRNGIELLIHEDRVTKEYLGANPQLPIGIVVDGHIEDRATGYVLVDGDFLGVVGLNDWDQTGYSGYKDYGSTITTNPSHAYFSKTGEDGGFTDAEWFYTAFGSTGTYTIPQAAGLHGRVDLASAANNSTGPIMPYGRIEVIRVKDKSVRGLAWCRLRNRREMVYQMPVAHTTAGTSAAAGNVGWIWKDGNIAHVITPPVSAATSANARHAYWIDPYPAFLWDSLKTANKVIPPLGANQFGYFSTASHEAKRSYNVGGTKVPIRFDYGAGRWVVCLPTRQYYMAEYVSGWAFSSGYYSGTFDVEGTGCTAIAWDQYQMCTGYQWTAATKVLVGYGSQNPPTYVMIEYLGDTALYGSSQFRIVCADRGNIQIV